MPMKNINQRREAARNFVAGIRNQMPARMAQRGNPGSRPTSPGRPPATPPRPPVGQTTSPARPPIGSTSGGSGPQMPGRSVAPPTPASIPGRGPSLPGRPPVAMKKGGKVTKAKAKGRT